MKNYEMMFIVKTTLEEAAVKNTVKEFSDIITSMNGKITNTKEMGQRELAYPINKEVSGFYYVFNLGNYIFQHINTFFQRKQWFFRCIIQNSDNYMVEYRRWSANDIQMSKRNRIKAARVNCCPHTLLSGRCLRKMVTAARPYWYSRSRESAPTASGSRFSAGRSQIIIPLSDKMSISDIFSREFSRKTSA